MRRLCACFALRGPRSLQELAQAADLAVRSLSWRRHPRRTEPRAGQVNWLVARAVSLKAF